MDIIDIVEIMDRKGDVMGITKGIYNQQYKYDIPTNHPWLDGWNETNKHNWGHQSSICSWKHPKIIDCWTWKPTKQCLVGAFKIILPDGFGTCCNSLFFSPQNPWASHPIPWPQGALSFAPLLPQALEMIVMRMAAEKDLRPTLLGPWVIEGVHRYRSLL